MSNPYTGAVAAALRKSELLLEAPAAGLARNALWEAALLQQWRAYRAFLAELAFQLQLGAEPETAVQLQQLASARGKTCSEAGELQELLRDPESWLSGLQAAWLQLWRFASDNGEKPGGNAALIPACDISPASAEPLSDASLRRWQAALAELVRRQRAQAEEW